MSSNKVESEETYPDYRFQNRLWDELWWYCVIRLKHDLESLSVMDKHIKSKLWQIVNNTLNYSYIWLVETKSAERKAANICFRGAANPKSNSHGSLIENRLPAWIPPLPPSPLPIAPFTPPSRPRPSFVPKTSPGSFLYALSIKSPCLSQSVPLSISIPYQVPLSGSPIRFPYQGAAWLCSQSWGFEYGKTRVQIPDSDGWMNLSYVIPGANSPRFVNSQLVCLLPVAILNWVYTWHWKAPLGELSLFFCFCFFFLRFYIEIED